MSFLLSLQVKGVYLSFLKTLRNQHSRKIVLNANCVDSNPALLIFCVMLGKLLNLSKPQFLHLKTGITDVVRIK